MKKLLFCILASVLVVGLALPMAIPVLADDTGFLFPTTYATGSTGNPPTNPGQALLDDVATGATNDTNCALFRTNNPGGGGGVADSEYYSTFGFTIPSGATIDGIEVVVSGYRTGGASGVPGAYFNVRINGGAGWTGYQGTSPTLTLVDAEYPLTGWSVAGLTAESINAGFQLEAVAAGPSNTGELWKLDSVRVKVYYTLPESSLHVNKFYDADVDGIKDEGELPLNWKVSINGTPAETPVEMLALTPGTAYTIIEADPTSPCTWVNTTPKTVEITLVSGDNVVNFGNVYLGAGGANSKGWWTNNGSGVGTDDLPALGSLNLVDEVGDTFDPTEYGIKEQGQFPAGSFAEWLQEADAVSMAYMLSAQLAAMKLNVLNSFVNGSAMVYAPGLLPYAPITGLNGFGFISVNDLMNAANSSLGSDPYTPSGHGQRAYQEALKDALDAANNNTNFVQPMPACIFYFP